MWHCQAHWQAGGAAGGQLSGVEHLHLPATPGQRSSNTGAGQARAHHRAACACPRHCRSGAAGATFQLPSGLEFGSCEPRGRQFKPRVEHKPALLERSVGPGRPSYRQGQPARSAGQAGQRLDAKEVPGCPFDQAGRAWVQENRVSLKALLTQQRLQLAHAKRQQQLAVVQADSVKARPQALALFCQCAGQCPPARCLMRRTEQQFWQQGLLA